MQLWSDFGKTVLFVTHDVEEAIYLSDEMHVMGTRPGRIITTIPITLPRPRLRTSALTPEFVAIKERCLRLLTVDGTTQETMTRAAAGGRRKDLPMAVQESSPPSEMARLERAQREPGPVAAAAKPARRLPVQRDWPTWALITAQVGILVGAISL